MGLRWLLTRFWPALLISVKRWSSDHGALHSAALAYYAAFSLFPLCLTLVAVLGLVARVSGRLQDRQQQMLDLVREYLGPWLTDQIQLLLLEVRAQAMVGGPLGLLTLALACLAIFVQLEAMVDSIWRLPEQGSQSWLSAICNVLYQRAIAFVMLLGVGALLILLFVGNMLLSGFKMFLTDLPVGQGTWVVASWLTAVLGNALLVTIIFRAIPRVPVRWRDAFCGGVLVALIWQIGQHVLALFVIGDHYSVYGVVGSFIAVMVWFYYASAVVFLGAELVRALGDSP